MVKFASILTITIWMAVLGWFGYALVAGRLYQPRGDLAFQVAAVILACCAIWLAWAATARRSVGISKWLFGISVFAALWSGFGIWMIISPIIVVGFGFFQHFTVVGWLFLAALVVMFITPFLWAVVCHQLRGRLTAMT